MTRFLIIAAFLATSSSWAQEKNPFEAVTGSEPLSESVSEDFHVGFQDADKILETAIRDSKGLRPDASFKITSRAAIDYFLQIGLRRQRLVSVLLLEQGLELAYGVPTATGADIKTPALLPANLNPDLKALIMREVVEMAADLAHRSQLKKDWTILDYEDAAVLRTARGLVWAQSALLEVNRYQILRALVAQWRNLLLKTDFQYPERWAGFVNDAEKRLLECPLPAPGGETQTMCVSHMGDLLKDILKGAKVPVDHAFLTYEELSHHYFGAITLNDQIIDMAAALRILSSGSLPPGSPTREQLEQKAWRITRSVADQAPQFKNEHRALLRNLLVENGSYQLNLHAAYLLAVDGNDSDLNAIAARGSTFVSSTQRLSFARIARNPSDVLSMLEMTR